MLLGLMVAVSAARQGSDVSHIVTTYTAVWMPRIG
jgi:hypothetical protein